MKKVSIALVVCFLLILISLTTLLMIGGKERVVEEEVNEKVNVVVSIVPLSGFVEKVGGDKVDVSVMVPQGTSPHTYEPKPSQLVDVSRADVFVKVGAGIDFELFFMDKIMAQNKEMFIVDCSKGIDLLVMQNQNSHDVGDEKERDHTEQEHNHHGTDPHIWLSPINAKIMAENICEGLINVDPKNGEYYTQNKDKYLEELDLLDKNLKENFSKIENGSFIVFHPAWGYFANEYDLEQIPIEVEGKEPSAQEIAHLIEVANKKNIKVVFVSPQFNSKTAEVIAKEIDGSVVFVDPLKKDYINNMYTISNEIIQGTGG